jgi:hypothetical protein
MEQSALKIINNHWNIKIYFYIETPGGKSFNLCLNYDYFFNTRLNYTSMAA